MSNPAAAPTGGRIRQMRQAYRLTKQNDRNIGLLLLLTFLVTAGIFGVIGWLVFGNNLIGLILTGLFAVMCGTLAALIVFGRRAEKAAYTQMEDQPGAAAGALQMLRRGWHVKPAVAVTRNQDVIHRAIGKPGVVLVGEGNSGRLPQLLSAEKKKTMRIVGEEVPVIEVIVGRQSGQIPLPRLNRQLRKMKRGIKPAQMTEVINKTKALDSMRPQVPMPRGPMNQNAMRGARKAMRG